MENMQRTLDEEVLKNQLVGWGVALPTIALTFSLGAGWFSVVLGTGAAMAALLWRLKKLERKAVAK